MIALIRHANVYAPERMGIQDVLIVAGKIWRIGKDLSEWSDYSGIKTIEGNERHLVPGFIDQHVHILGGGGAAGFGSRGPELSFTETVLAGITTVVGCVGADQVGRDLHSLLAKTRSLEFRGITAKMLSGGFDHRVTLTGNVKTDLYLIDNVIGSKAAVSDRRSVQPSHDELKRLMAESMIGGLLSDKAGIVQIHMGDAATGLTPLMTAQKESEVPIKYIVPTHINRNELLMEQAIEWTRMGGVVDLTPGIAPPDFKRAVKSSKGVMTLLAAGVPVEQITLSTDANGVHTIHGFENISRNPLTLLYNEFCDLVLKEGLSIVDSLKCVSTNVARVLRMPEKGRIVENADADLLMLEPDSLKIDMVIARGKILAENGKMTNPQKLDV